MRQLQLHTTPSGVHTIPSMLQVPEPPLQHCFVQVAMGSGQLTFSSLFSGFPGLYPMYPAILPFFLQKRAKGLSSVMSDAKALSADRVHFWALATYVNVWHLFVFTQALKQFRTF